MIPSNQAGLLMESGEVDGSGGDSIGKVGQVYVDNETGRLTWVTVKTGWFGSNESFVPLDKATLEGSTVTVPYDRAKVKDAPHHAVDSELSVEEEQDLYTYYGLTHSDGGSDIDNDTTYTAGDVTGTGTGTATETVGTETVGTDALTTGTAAASDDGYITRSEEQLHVGTRTVEAGRARLKKFVVTEQQTVTVPVSHEEVTLVREPLTAGEVTEAVIGEDVVEVLLTEDQVVVDKEAVAVERVSLGTETVTEQQTVTEAVRKEQVELSTDGVETTGVRSGTTDTADGTEHAEPGLADRAKGLVDKAKDAIK